MLAAVAVPQLLFRRTCANSCVVLVPGFSVHPKDCFVAPYDKCDGSLYCPPSAEMVRADVPKPDKMDGWRSWHFPKCFFLTATDVTSEMCQLRTRQENTILSTWRFDDIGVGRSQRARGGSSIVRRLASIVFLPLGLETDTVWPGGGRTGAQVVLRYWSTEDQGQNAKGSVWGDGETGNAVVRPVAEG